jgi:hypothetical protein
MAYEKNSVKDLLQEPFSSRPVGLSAGAIRTGGGASEDRHGPHLSSRHSTTKRAIAKRRGIVGITERQIVNPYGALLLPTALFYSTFASYTLASRVDQRTWISQHSKRNQPYTEEGRTLG